MINYYNTLHIYVLLLLFHTLIETRKTQQMEKSEQFSVK